MFAQFSQIIKIKQLQLNWAKLYIQIISAQFGCIFKSNNSSSNHEIKQFQLSLVAALGFASASASSAPLSSSTFSPLDHSSERGRTNKFLTKFTATHKRIVRLGQLDSMNLKKIGKILISNF